MSKSLTSPVNGNAEGGGIKESYFLRGRMRLKTYPAASFAWQAHSSYWVHVYLGGPWGADETGRGAGPTLLPSSSFSNLDLWLLFKAFHYDPPLVLRGHHWSVPLPLSVYPSWDSMVHHYQHSLANSFNFLWLPSLILKTKSYSGWLIQPSIFLLTVPKRQKFARG